MSKLKYDSFISYASEDKAKLVEPLASKLRSMNLSIWFDDFELKPGDSLSEKISKGLNQSRYGICVFSPAFFNKPWPKFELKGMIQLLLTNKLKIIPVWYSVTQQQVVEFNPSIADIVAIKTDGKDVNRVFLKALSVISPKSYNTVLRKVAFDNVANTTEEEKVEMSDLKEGEIKHKTLPKSAISRANLICNALADTKTDFTTLDSFLDGMKRDTHYEDELLVWEAIASKYLEINREMELNLQQKKEILQLLLGKSMGVEISRPTNSQKTVLKVSAKRISDKQVDKIFKKLKNK